MSHYKYLSIALSILLMIGSGAMASTPAVRIYVPCNGLTAQAHGYLSGYGGKAEFVLSAHRGQQLTIQTVRGATIIMLTLANGATVGEPGGLTVNIAQTGDVRIEVTEHQMAEPWSGPFTLDVKLR